MGIPVQTQSRSLPQRLPPPESWLQYRQTLVAGWWNLVALNVNQILEAGGTDCSEVEEGVGVVA